MKRVWDKIRMFLMPHTSALISHGRTLKGFTFHFQEEKILA